ncbi:hypothetical protein PFISCL1PPCAC_2282, partial [Pristionchus fissidentatus]
FEVVVGQLSVRSLISPFSLFSPLISPISETLQECRSTSLVCARNRWNRRKSESRRRTSSTEGTSTSTSSPTTPISASTSREQRSSLPKTSRRVRDSRSRELASSSPSTFSPRPTPTRRCSRRTCVRRSTATESTRWTPHSGWRSSPCSLVTWELRRPSMRRRRRLGLRWEKYSTPRLRSTSRTRVFPTSKH